MARITVEDCLRQVESRFELVMLAARRAKMIMKGAKPLVDRGNRPIVTALREIAAGKVKFIDPSTRKEFALSSPKREPEKETPEG